MFFLTTNMMMITTVMNTAMAAISPTYMATFSPPSASLGTVKIEKVFEKHVKQKKNMKNKRISDKREEWVAIK